MVLGPLSVHPLVIGHAIDLRLAETGLNLSLGAQSQAVLGQMAIARDEHGQSSEPRESSSRNVAGVGSKVHRAARIFIQTADLLFGAMTSVGARADYGRRDEKYDEAFIPLP